jgi:preprotein translocase subunit SecY
MVPELIKRGGFTLGALLVYGLGLRIPLPGVDAAAWTAVFDAASAGMLGQADALSGGALRTLGILSLSITPYVTAAILLQLISMVSRRLRALADDERGRGIIGRATVAITVVLAALQGYGIAVGLEGIAQVVPEPGPLFRLVTMLTLTAGTLFLVWLAAQMTARGIGNGIALLMAAGIVNALPRDIAALIEGSRQAVVAPGTMTIVSVVTFVIIAIVVVAEHSRRRLPIEFAERAVGNRALPRQSAVLALKLNPAGLLPSYMAALLLSVILVAAM